MIFYHRQSDGKKSIVHTLSTLTINRVQDKKAYPYQHYVTAIEAIA